MFQFVLNPENSHWERYKATEQCAEIVYSTGVIQFKNELRAKNKFVYK